MARRRKWNWQQYLREIDSWLCPDDPGDLELSRDVPRSDVEAELRVSQPNFNWIASRLSLLGHYASQVGVSAVLHGKPEGWSSLRLGLEFQAWHVRLRYAEVRRTRARGWSADSSDV